MQSLSQVKEIMLTSRICTERFMLLAVRSWLPCSLADTGTLTRTHSALKYHPFQNKEPQVMNEWTNACVHHLHFSGQSLHCARVCIIRVQVEISCHYIIGLRFAAPSTQTLLAGRSHAQPYNSVA